MKKQHWIVRNQYVIAVILSVFFAILLNAGHLFAASTQSEQVLQGASKAYIEADGYLYAEPKVSAKVIGKVKRGEVVTTLLVRDAENKYKWVFIETSSGAGWLHARATFHVK